MARQKDADKRQLILGEAKRMFAGKGYDGTSMAALATAISIPVGSLYTYFDSKEGLLNTIIEEGWREFSRYLEEGLSAVAGVAGTVALPRLAFLVRKAFPELFKDLDLIAILLAQADRSSRLGEKLEYLASLIASIIMDSRGAEGESAGVADGEAMGGATGEAMGGATRGAAATILPNLRAGLSVMLLGSLETMRLIHRAGIAVEADEVIAFLVLTIEGALGCSLPPICEPGDPPSTTVARSGSLACAEAAGR
ncbi:MAG TPA: TetR/AcrR family transcriptional regulator [Rectinemataceae bacterium]|nr:TetR/AcrR family transcriptional regulator [Rectinemataceae bacterium]